MQPTNGRAPSSIFSDEQAVKAAMLHKLQESNLDTRDAQRLHFIPYTAEAVQRTLHELPVARAGFQIPYFNSKGELTDFYRFRYLEYKPAKGIASLVNPKHVLRYGQPRDSANKLYLPPNVDWRRIQREPDHALLLTEGELKAACACKQGITTAGLGGVWNFRNGTPALIADFDEFKWEGRSVYIVYDSDAVRNTQVLQAENALAQALLDRGAIPFIVRLPSLFSDRKTGLDDFIVARGKKQLAKLLTATDPWDLAAALHRLNEEVVYVRNPGLILCTRDGFTFNTSDFTRHQYRHYKMEQTVLRKVKDKEVESHVTVSAPEKWLEWPLRRTVPYITFKPDEDSKITEEEGAWNLWEGWPLKPDRGEVRRFTALLDYLFKGARKEHRRWVEQWMAYPLQYPGTKMFTVIVLWGRHQGTGKSLLGQTLMKIYNGGDDEKYAVEADENRLFYNNFNNWQRTCLFVLGDEIIIEDKRNMGDRLKNLVTRKNVVINKKFQDSYTLPDLTNYFFTSNHENAVYIEDLDRRFFVHEVTQGPRPMDFYHDFVTWRDTIGLARIFDYLLHVDLRGFDPQAPAPMTEFKQEMIDLNRSDLASWICMLRDDPGSVLRIGDKALPYSLVSAEELLLLYDPTNQKRVTVNGIARELKRAGIGKVWGGNAIKIGDKVKRLYALRNAEQYVRSNCKQLADAYLAERKNIAVDGRKVKFA